MSIYIDKYVAFSTIFNAHCKDCKDRGDRCNSCYILDILKEFDNMPTADVQEVKHGKWIHKRTIYHDGELYCSICDWESDVKLKYCPSCGARMNEEEN